MWISATDVLLKLLDEARGDAARLGHRASGWAETTEPGVYLASCPLCWATGTVTVRKLRAATSAGALLNMRCLPARPTAQEIAEASP